MAARYWLDWNERAEQVATWRYRVEDLHASALVEICERTNVSCRRGLVLSIPRNFNTRQKASVHIAKSFFRRAGLKPRERYAPIREPTMHYPVTWSLLRGGIATLREDQGEGERLWLRNATMTMAQRSSTIVGILSQKHLGIFRRTECRFGPGCVKQGGSDVEDRRFGKPMGAPDVRTRDREDPVPRVHGRSRKAGFPAGFGKRRNSLPDPHVQIGKIAGRISVDLSVKPEFDNNLIIVFGVRKRGNPVSTTSILCNRAAMVPNSADQPDGRPPIGQRDGPESSGQDLRDP